MTRRGFTVEERALGRRLLRSGDIRWRNAADARDTIARWLASYQLFDAVTPGDQLYAYAVADRLARVASVRRLRDAA